MLQKGQYVVVMDGEGATDYRCGWVSDEMCRNVGHVYVVKEAQEDRAVRLDVCQYDPSAPSPGYFWFDAKYLYLYEEDEDLSCSFSIEELFGGKFA